MKEENVNNIEIENLTSHRYIRKISKFLLPAKTVGRRKSAVAKVKLVLKFSEIHKPKEAQVQFNFQPKLLKVKITVIVNGRKGEDYFQFNLDYLHRVSAPLVVLGLGNSYKIVAETHGGGLKAQSEAIRLAVTRQLKSILSPKLSNKSVAVKFIDCWLEHRSLLKALGFLTRDSRTKERKKYGLKKARKAPQYSKR